MDGMPATQYAGFVKKTKMKNNYIVILFCEKKTMKELIQKTIDLLKRKVRENLEIINKNQTRLNEMLNQPFSSERTYMIEKNYSANKSLLSENNDLISLQLNLVNFLEKHKETLTKWEDDNEPVSELDITSFLDEEELFELTIQGKLGFETGHPRYKDEAFFTKLLNYYASIEAYEKCNAIITQRRKNQVS
jgi:hypothetical protein